MGYSGGCYDLATKVMKIDAWKSECKVQDRILITRVVVGERLSGRKKTEGDHRPLIFVIV